jgi:group I intron endonuclease
MLRTIPEKQNIKQTMIIYKVTNNINGKYYIGCTINSLNKRKRSHIDDSNRGSKLLFHLALKKYGQENFTWEIIDDLASNFEDLKLREMFWIWHWQSHGPLGYNLTDGGDGTIGLIPKEETRKKMSEARKGKPSYERTNELKNYMSEIKTGVKRAPFSEETRKNMSLSKIGKKVKPFSDEHKQNISKSKKGKPSTFKGRKHTDESILKQKIAHSDISEETRIKISCAKKGKPPWNKGLKGVQVAWNKGKKNDKCNEK